MVHHISNLFVCMKTDFACTFLLESCKWVQLLLLLMHCEEEQDIINIHSLKVYGVCQHVSACEGRTPRLTHYDHEAAFTYLRSSCYTWWLEVSPKHVSIKKVIQGFVTTFSFVIANILTVILPYVPQAYMNLINKVAASSESSVLLNGVKHLERC